MVTDTAAQGLRLLALVCKRTAPRSERLGPADMDAGYVLLALLGIIDPPREEAIRAVSECHRAGIRVKMITGDHTVTAHAIGARLAIGVGTFNRGRTTWTRWRRRVPSERSNFSQTSSHN